MFKEVNIYLLEKIKIKKLIWISKIGINDAASTGIVTGFVWALKSLIVSLISKDKTINNCKIDVQPIYSQNQFETYFNCIIKLKLVYIIIAGFIGLKAKFKGGESSV
ncbi:hypothetical protein L21TH_0846 [Caldisalinibacter kiritimatiensis]|uniref:DUF2953 domain-containing protein n=1 Tax=Caldisalinibacter kiritimatiensis TaxID=1304284 RepID=R1AV78_9FIRM|nr:hypothetical protein L21TH_0846 [Caldisalinibacter kiritimatiensis]